MNRSFAIIFLTTLTVGQAVGKSGELKLDRSVRPSKPFSAQVPEGLAWQVKIVPKQKAEAGGSSASAKPGQAEAASESDPAATHLAAYRALKQREMVQGFSAAFAAGLRQENLRFGGGREVERFQRAGLVAYKDWKTGQVAVDVNGFSASGPLFGIGSFEELSWITPAHYAGAAEFGGRPCFVFREYPNTNATDRKKIEEDPIQGAPEERIRTESAGIPASKAGAEPVASPTLTAFIDAETMLPLALQKPDETWVYQVTDTKAQPRMSNEIAAALKAREKAFENLRNKYRAAP